MGNLMPLLLGAGVGLAKAAINHFAQQQAANSPQAQQGQQVGGYVAEVFIPGMASGQARFVDLSSQGQTVQVPPTFRG